MSLYFGFSYFAVSTYVERLKPCLKAALQAQGIEKCGLFVNQAQFDQKFGDIEDLVIDVTEIPIERAVNQQVQQEHYSGKKNGIR